MEKKHYKYLDYIRVLFCIGVLFYHLNILKGGYLAVCSFFVLSGYLSYKSLFKKDKISLKEYYLNKLKRIYLPLLITVFISIFIISFFKDITWVSLKQETISILLGYNNFWQLNANLDYFARHIDSPFMHLWYIGILIQFDLIFPFIYMILKKIREKFKAKIELILTTIITLILTGLFFYSSIKLNIMTTYYNTIFRIFSIFFGITLAVLNSNYKTFTPNNKILKNTIFIVLNLSLILMFIMVPSSAIYFNVAMFLSTIITCILIDYSTSTESKDIIIDKPIKFISDISYEIYLVQYPLIFIFQYLNLSVHLTLILIISLTIITSFLINYSLKLKEKNILKIIILILILIPTILGLYKFIITKDNTKEMKELEAQLAENEKIMLERQKVLEKNRKQEQQDFEKLLSEIEQGEQDLNNVVTNLPVTGVGDSVMLGALPNLYQKFPNGYFDAKISRTAWVVNGILRDIKSSNLLGDIVILNLGANGDCPDEEKENILNTIGDREVFWINVTNYKDVNDRLQLLANKHSNVHIVDWYNISKGHYEYFVADGIHLTDIGRVAYTETIYNSIYNVYLERINIKKQELLNKQEGLDKEKITFIGNDLLLNLYDYIKDINNSDYVIEKELNYEILKNKINELKTNKQLSYNVYILLDKNTNITKEQLNKIIELLKDNKVTLVITKELNYTNENINIINFNKELNNNKSYYSVDNIHLSQVGNKRLSEIIKLSIKNK